MIKLINLLREVRINKPIEGLAFVRNNKERIIKEIENLEKNFEEDTGITDINSVVFSETESAVIVEMFRDVDVEFGMPEDAFEVSISQSEEDSSSCRGLSISNIPGETWDLIGSGDSHRKIPNIKFKGQPLYYMVLWC